MRRIGITIAALLALVPAAQAQTDCRAAIDGFQRIIEADAETGNLNRSVYMRIGPQLAPLIESCRAGHDSEAMHVLHALKSRYGYR